MLMNVLQVHECFFIIFGKMFDYWSIERKTWVEVKIVARIFAN